MDMEVQGVPRIGTREASTRVAVKDNETVVIGGLFTSDETNTNATLPFWERLPLIKYLFWRSNKTRSERELVVFITPHILSKSHYTTMSKQRNKMNTLIRQQKICLSAE